MENYEEERGQRIKIVALTAAAAVALIAVVALGIGLVLPKHSHNHEHDHKEGEKSQQSQTIDKSNEADKKSEEKGQGQLENAKQLPETGPSMALPIILAGGFIAGYAISKKLIKLEEETELMDY